jgi:acyl-CoA synthetase (AMP-forming)/AMP-acid ligase II
VLIGGHDDAIALVSSAGREVTYAELRRRVDRGAAALAAGEIEAGRVVAVAVADPSSFVVAVFAAWKTGAVVVPVDTRAGEPLVVATADRAGASALVRGVNEDGELVAERLEGRPMDARASLVLFTSGSSAEPKGVVLSAAGVEANVRAIVRYLPLDERARTAVVVPLSYGYGLVGQVMTTLHVGGTLVLLSDVTYPALQLVAMRRHRASGLSAVPTSLRSLARVALESPASDRPALGYVASAGGVLDAATVDLLRDAFPTARLFNQYGLTEASPRVTAIEATEAPFARGSVGRPLDGITVWAADADGVRVEPGVEGQLYVRGPSVMLGYLGDPAATERALTADGALRTGDSGWVDDGGYVFVAGRADGVVKCGGERVSVEEIAALLRTADGVRDAYVVAIAHPELGAKLHAFVEGDGDLTASLRLFVQGRLPPAKRPSRFVTMPALPRTANGKVARAELPMGDR